MRATVRGARRAFFKRRGPPELALLGAAAFLTHRWSSAPDLRLACSGQVPLGGRPKAVLVRNGHAAEPWMSKDSLLKDYHGAYTTARTVDRTSIFELSMHCSRLHNTALTLLQEAAKAEPTEAMQQADNSLSEAGPQGLKPLLRQEILSGLDFLGNASDLGTDYQVTVLLTWDTAGPTTPCGRGFDVFTFMQPLPYIEPMVAIEAHRAVRRNPTIKDVQWVSDRGHLEDLQRKAKVNEVVMFDDEGRITEGLQTNFAAVTADGVLVTAPDERVLAGTVRKVLLEVAADQGIPVRFECPNINDLNTWDSCLICSTSRLIKPVRELGVPDLALHRHFPKEKSKAHLLEELVKEAVLATAKRCARVPGLLPSELVQRRPVFDQLIVNCYRPGQGIKRHVDLLKFDDGVMGICLGADAILRMRQLRDDKTAVEPGGECQLEDGDFTGEVVDVEVKAGDVYALAGSARYSWTHEIPASSVRGGRRRLSLTLRKMLPSSWHQQ